MSDWTFILAAYGLTWTVLAGYTLYLKRRRKHAAETLEEATPGSGGGR